MNWSVYGLQTVGMPHQLHTVFWDVIMTVCPVLMVSGLMAFPKTSELRLTISTLSVRSPVTVPLSAHSLLGDKNLKLFTLWTLGALVFGLSWLAVTPRGPSSLYFPSAGIMSAHLHVCWRSNSGPHACATSALPTMPASLKKKNPARAVKLLGGP